MRPTPVEVCDRLIVALDLPTVELAERVIDRLEGITATFKIGPHLLFDADIGKIYTRQGISLFVDAKLLDVPSVVAAGIMKMGDQGVVFATVHARKPVIEAALEAGRHYPHLRIFGVTTLTSEPLQGDVAHAMMIGQMGLDGMVCAGNDLALVTRDHLFPDLLAACPGIRFEGDPPDDQRRTCTVKEAVQNGADYVILGRPIVGHIDGPNDFMEIQAVHAIHQIFEGTHNE